MYQSIEWYYYLFFIINFFILMFFFFRTLKMMQNKKWGAGFRNSSYLLVALFFLIILSLIGSNVLTYHRLTHESPIALLDIEQIKHQQFRVKLLQLENCRKLSYDINGDEWQLDARIIKWHGWANLLGLDASFQLDRISGRYQSIAQQRSHLPTVYSLETKQKYDLWALKTKYNWLPWLDAKYGQSVFLAMKNDQSYQIFMTQSGLIARAFESDINTNEQCHF